MEAPPVQILQVVNSSPFGGSIFFFFNPSDSFFPFSSSLSCLTGSDQIVALWVECSAAVHRRPTGGEELFYDQGRDVPVGFSR